MSDAKESYTVRILPDGLTLEVPHGAILMDAMHQANIYFDFPCGGGKKCGKCRVRVHNDCTPNELSEQHRGAISIRLACMTEVNNNLTVEFLGPKIRRHQVLSMSLERKVDVNPHIKKHYVQVDPPTLADYRSDWHRIQDLLRLKKKYNAPLNLLRVLPQRLRSQDYKITLIMHNNEILAIEAGDTTQSLLGMAFDIGTTTVVGYLLDLRTGKELAAVSALNPQTQFGADVISRALYADKVGGVEKLQTAVITVANQLVLDATEKAGVSSNDIYALSVVGNTSMHHLFLGINPHQLPMAPYVSAVSRPLVIEAKDLNIAVNHAARVFVLPNIAGFIGADTVAVLLAAEMDQSEDIKLVIDIGTNGEIALGSVHKLVTCSTAAGPAFEGAQISCGMRGSTGAIEYISFNEALSYSVIGDGKPQGICGSALLDAMAGLLQLGFINRNGRFVAPEQITRPEAIVFKERLIQREGMWAFLVAAPSETEHGRPIMITQKDIREFQMAKGAIASGIKLLSAKYGIDVSEIQEVLLAGAFGNYLNPRNACALGLIPPELENRVKMIGNAAGAGAKLALLSVTELERAVAISRSVEHVELGVHPEFMKTYAESMYF